MHRDQDSAPQTHSKLQRSIAGIVLLSFLALNTAPAAAAVRKEIESPSAPAAPAVPRADETQRLMEQLQSELAALQRQIQPSRDLIVKTQRKDQKTGKTVTDISIIGTPAAPKVKALQERIAKLAAGLRKEDEVTLAQFEADRQHIVASKLPAVILERHAEAVQQFRSRSREMQARLEKLGKAGTVLALHDQGQGLIQQLKVWNPSRHQPFDPKNLPFGSADPKVREPRTSPADLRKVLAGQLPPQPVLDVADRREDVSASYVAAIDKAAMEGDRYRIPADPVQVASVGSTVGLMASIPVPGPEYLAPTEDVQITPAIQAKAAALHNQPVEIYNWVRSHIEFIPTYGSIQGSDMTLQTLRGNAFDTASLLIALLRAAGTPARYVYGTVEIPIDQAMNWVGGVSVPNAALNLLGQGGIPSLGLAQGGVVKAVRIEHVWVEAFVDYYPSRGAKNLAPDAWVPMDASFKQYQYSSGMNLQQAVPFDAESFASHLQQTSTVNETEGWVSGVDQTYIQTQLSQYQDQLKEYIDSQNPGATVGEVLGSKLIATAASESLGASLPYRLVTRGSAPAGLASSVRTSFAYELQSEYGDTLFRYSASTPQLAGKKLALSFRPASQADEDTIASYLPKPHEDGSPIQPEELPQSLPGYQIRLVPEFTVDGVVVATGTAQQMGAGLRTVKGYTSPKEGERTREKTLVVGEYHAVGLDLQGVGTGQLGALKAGLEVTKARLEAESFNGLTKHDLTGDLLQTGILSYFAVNDVQDRLGSRSSGVVDYRLPSFGTFQTNLETIYRYGVPRDVRLPGVMMDVDHLHNSVETVDAVHSREVSYFRASGARMSAFEHLVPEQLFNDPGSMQPAEGVSAVKALSIAASQGQRIYTITQANLSVLGGLAIEAAVKDDIRNAVNAGYEATVHQQRISHHGFSGTGYLLIDPGTGAGGYKISGGADGAWLETLLAGVLVVTSLLPFFLILAVVLGPLLALAIAITVAWVVVLIEIQQLEQGAARAILANLAWGAFGIALGAVSGSAVLALAMWILGSIGNYFISSIGDEIREIRYA